jgi:DNA-binding CsgD family transcriptional regulator
MESDMFLLGVLPPTAMAQQERRLLDLIAEGKTNREIAGALYLAELRLQGARQAQVEAAH